MVTNMTTTLMVEDVSASVVFYQDVLGFTLANSVPAPAGGLQFAILAKDSCTLMLQEKNNLIEEYPTLATPKVQPSVTLYITVDNFDELYQNLQAKHTILCDVHTTFYGGKEFAIADNSGYVLRMMDASRTRHKWPFGATFCVVTV